MSDGRSAHPPVNGLVEFLLARVAEDEVLARAVERDLPGRVGEPYEDGSGILDEDEYPSYRWGHKSKAELPFMARWHPRTVLAEVAAKRRIVELHTPKDRTGRHLCPVCVSWELWRSQEPGEALPLDDAPCSTLRLLALPYASHAEYQESWKPV